jgi:hypothetical protein
LIGGPSCDIAIFNNCDDNLYQSYSKLGDTFRLPQGILPYSPESRSYLAGSEQFKVLEIEAFRVSFY